ncbi:rhombosortase [Desulfurispirillum indicum]|uniref:rhombosortase n=1 Tax=Desulfurispirillum indicum TaxID=936456 RepID=UPI001CFC2DB2|nr:rhombosortase [Desulfurispirillum indicum]UCZ57306.1 rhombosortase [Desulfurispirillum indicum]
MSSSPLFFIVLLSALLLIVGLLPEGGRPWLAYDRHAIESGQYWRLWSAHVAHLTLWHLLLNLAGWLLLLGIFRDLLSSGLLWLWFLISAPMVSLLLYLRDISLGGYAGLSGLLYGLLSACLFIGWRRNPILHSLALILLAIRLLWEQQPGYDTGYLEAWIAGQVHVNAHLYGAMCGGVLAAIVACRSFLRTPRP